MESQNPNMKVLLNDNNSEPEDKSSRSGKMVKELDNLNLGQTKKLLVISLGGLLLRRIHFKDTVPTNRRPDIVYGKFRVFKRPYCDDFLKFCFERFEVGLWSSAMEHNLDDVLQTVIGELRSKLLFVWDQEKCTNSGFSCLYKADKPIFLKELKKVWDDNSTHGKYSSSNTLLIVDEPYKALLNPPNTAIFPKKYRVENARDTFLGPKGELQMYLDGLANANCVTEYVKEHPFGQPPISPAHPNWGYYSKIIRLIH